MQLTLNNKLNPVQLTVLELYYVHGQSFEKIGKSLNLSRQRIERIQKASLRILRPAALRRNLEDFLSGLGFDEN